MTELLNITEVAPSQNQKEVTVNDALRALEQAHQRVTSIDMSGGAVSLTETQFTRNAIFQCSGHSTPVTLTVPTTIDGNTSNRVFIVQNRGTDTVVVTLGSGSTVDVATDTAIVILSDGTNLWPISGGGERIFDLGTFIAGSPTSSEVVLQYVASRPLTFPAGLTGSQGFAATAPAAQTVFAVARNGVGVGTITFAAEGNTASFVAAAAIDLAPGDRITVIAPEIADAMLADVSLTLQGLIAS